MQQENDSAKSAHSAEAAAEHAEGSDQFSEHSEQPQAAATESAATESETAAPAADSAGQSAVRHNPKAKWYVLHVFSGSEKKVIEQIQDTARRQNLLDDFVEFLIPSRPVTEVRRGKRIKSDKFFFPGYMLIKMVMRDETRHLVQSQSKVTDFLLNNGKPQAITEDDAIRIQELANTSESSPENLITFYVGEKVRVADGPFSSFNGEVEDVDSTRQRLKVSVSIFGRSTPVELAFTQVEKL